MSWNRTKYDTCAYQKELSQSTSNINYAMDPNKFYNHQECRADLGIIAGNNVSVTKNNMVDLESDLLGITRQNTLCPERKFIPHCSKCSEISGIKGKDTCKISGVTHLPECDIIKYQPRINHVGYSIKYPSCGGVQDKTRKYPPQLNPTHN